MYKNSELKFNFSETKNLVRAELIECNKVVFSFESEELPTVRIRLPLPDEDKMIESALYWVENDCNFSNVESWFGFYTHSREKEIREEIQEIRKSLKRIKRRTESIEIANNAYLKYVSNIP